MLVDVDEAAVESWICPSNVSLDQYQIDLVKSALVNDCVVILPAGIDRMLVSSIVMYNYSRFFPNLKCVFITNSIAKAESARASYHSIFGLSASSQVLSTNQTPSERCNIWSISKCKCYFTIPQVLNNDILTKNCSLSSVSLFIFDSLNALLQILVTKDLIRAVRESQSCHRILGLADVCSNLSRLSAEVTSLLRVNSVQCLSLHSEPFSSTLEKLQLIRVQTSDEHQRYMEGFDGQVVKPVADRIVSMNTAVRFPPISKLTVQILNRIKETCIRNTITSTMSSLFDQLFDLLSLRDELQYNGYADHQMLHSYLPSSVHPKVTACCRFSRQHEKDGRLVFVSQSHNTCLALQEVLPDASITHVDELRDISFSASDHVLFTSCASYFYDLQSSDRIVVNSKRAVILLLEQAEEVIYERSLKALKDTICDIVSTKREQSLNAIILPKVPDIMLLRFESKSRPENLEESRPGRSFITERMLSDAPYPAFESLKSSNDVIYKVSHGLKTRLLQQIMNLSGDTTESSFATMNFESFIESWCAAHSDLVNLQHFFVPLECYESTRTGLISEIVNEQENIQNTIATCKNEQEGVVKRTRGQIIESSDQPSSPIYKRPRQDECQRSKNNKTESRFVDIEAGVSGSDVDDDALEECSSMLDFIDDRSEITISSSMADSQSQSQVAPSSLMAFYRQSLLSSQPSAFSQPSRRFGRKLKVKIPSIEKYTNEAQSEESSRSQSGSPSASSTELLGSALQEMDWSDENLEI